MIVVAKISIIHGIHHWQVCAGVLVSIVIQKASLEAGNLSISEELLFSLYVIIIICQYSHTSLLYVIFLLREHHKCLVMVPYLLEDLTWNH